MRRLDPQSLIGPRSYFTDIDPKITICKKDLEKYRLEIERRLKIQLLTKTNIVCAASHLASNFSFEFFKSNPVLFEKELIKPALREDVQKISHYIDCKKNLSKDICDYYQNSVNSVITWNLRDNAQWFKDRVLDAISNENSELRLNLSPDARNRISRLYEEISKTDLLTRKTLQSNIFDFSKRDKVVLFDYINMVYHLSGARVVNCESAFPQENYIDYTLTDLYQKRMNNSEERIFIKYIFESGFELMYGNKLPIELIDTFSFEDIALIRKPLLESDFPILYEDLLNKCAEQMKNPKLNDSQYIDTLFDAVDISISISVLIQEHLQNELDPYLKTRGYEKDLTVSGSCLKFFISALQTLPIVGNIIQFGDTINSARYAYVNVLSTLSNQKHIPEQERYQLERDHALRNFINTTEISNSHTILDVLNLLKEYNEKKYQYY